MRWQLWYGGESPGLGHRTISSSPRATHLINLLDG